MIIHCPSCGYSRTPTDTAPISECPNCGINFQQWLSATISTEAASTTPGKKHSALGIAVRLIAFIFFTVWSYFGLIGSAALLGGVGTCSFDSSPLSLRCIFSAWHLNAYAFVTCIAWLTYFWMGGAWVLGKTVSRRLVVIGISAGVLSAAPWLLLANLGKSYSLPHSALTTIGMLFLIGAPTMAFAAYLARKHWLMAPPKQS
jgi:hypothetical protein